MRDYSPAHFGGRVQGPERGLGFFRGLELRTAVYVDGFNLFYRALRRSPYRWLDLLALSQRLLQPTNKVVLLRYFTARVNATSADPDKHVRQAAYLKAISAHIPCLEIHEGTFLKSVVRMRLSAPIPGVPRMVEVDKTEEKGSDVNLAVHLVGTPSSLRSRTQG